MCSWVFHMKVPTRSPASIPRPWSATARRSARAATSANGVWRLPSPWKVTTSLSPCTVRPWRKIMPTVSGKSCMVDCIIVPFSPGAGRDRRSVLGPVVSGPRATRAGQPP